MKQMLAIAPVLSKVVYPCLYRVRSAVAYINKDFTVKATRRFKPNQREQRIEIVLTIGAPNYEQRKFIKLCKQAGEKLPLKKIQYKVYQK